MNIHLIILRSLMTAALIDSYGFLARVEASASPKGRSASGSSYSGSSWSRAGGSGLKSRNIGSSSIYSGSSRNRGGWGSGLPSWGSGMSSIYSGLSSSTGRVSNSGRGGSNYGRGASLGASSRRTSYDLNQYHSSSSIETFDVKNTEKASTLRKVGKFMDWKVGNQLTNKVCYDKKY